MADSEVKSAVAAHRKSLGVVVLFSLVLILLSISPSIYMLEVYDRVITSRSEVTLFILTVCVLLTYVFQELLDLNRKYLLKKIGRVFESSLLDRVFWAIHKGVLERYPGISMRAMSDLKDLRIFFSSVALIALIELPLATIYLAIIFYIDYHLGILSLIGVVVQVVLLAANHYRVHPHLEAAQQAHMYSQNQVSNYLRNAEVAHSMGMLNHLIDRWRENHNLFLIKQAIASDSGASLAALGKFVQQLQTSAILGVGCWISINSTDPYLGGVVILVSILSGKVLQPMIQLVSTWQIVTNAFGAFGRLRSLLLQIPAGDQQMPLPVPKGHLKIEGLTTFAPQSSVPIIKGMSLEILAGENLCVVGPSGSGKSNLLKAIVGVWPSRSGKVRLDGGDMFVWNKSELGPHVGYLPQEIELLDGTIAENVARFGNVDMQRVRESIQLVGLEGFVEALPLKYETYLRDEGMIISGGERQRLGLARAIYGDPRLVVLDEPNSNLDRAGDEALLDVLRLLKSKKCTVIVVSHRTNLINESDKLLIMVDGSVKLFGPKVEVLHAVDAAKKKHLTRAVEKTSGII